MQVKKYWDPNVQYDPYAHHFSKVTDVLHQDRELNANNYLKALKSGAVHLTAKLVSNPTKTLVFNIQITANTKTPESIALSADTLYLAMAGVTEQLTVKATPSSASAAVTWSIADNKIASVTVDGIVSGLQKGTTLLLVVSKEKATIRDSAWVVVSDPVPVESVHFLKDSTTLFIGGAVETLVATVLPIKANQTVVYTVLDPTKVNLLDGAIKGLVEGVTWVVAKSVENASKADSLKVAIMAIQHADAVNLTPRSLKLFIGGLSGTLTATVLPSTVTQKIQWRSSNAAIAKVDATGKVTPMTAGTAMIYAQSQADSSKRDSADILVKRDSPQVSIGPDTVISIGQTLNFLPVVAPQEYGVVTQFKWDLDGNLAWDDSSTVVKSVSYKFDLEKEYLVRFYVRDTEGNETIVSRKVKATKVPTVNFLTPQVSGTYLTRASTVDISGSTNSPSGAGAISKVTYTVAGVAGTLATNLATNGSGTWSIKGIPLVNNSTIDIKVIATDSFGISGQAMLSVQMDSTAPGKPIILGTSPTATLPKWTWTSGGGGTGDYRFKLGDANFAANAPEVKSLEYPLTSAISKTLYTLYVEERDAAGNWSLPASLTIFYDLSKPVVSIALPQASGTYLTKAGTVDLTGGSSSPQGVGAIKALVYTVDGVAGALATNLTGDGSWSIKSLPLVANQTVVIKVTATDNIGNQGEATLSVTMDNIAPAAPVYATFPPAIVNSADTRTSLQWTWNRSVPAADSFIVRLNGVEVSRQMGTSYTVSDIPDKNYALEIVEFDFAGNFGGPVSAAIVTVDRSPPSTPVVSISESPTRNSKATWSWSSGGSGQYEYRLSNSAPTGIGTAYTGAAYTPVTGLADGSWQFQLREKDAAGNWSPWSPSSVVIIKVAAPTGPSISRNASPTNAPKWTWTPGVGGNGTYRYRWSGNSSYVGEGALTEYAPTLTDGAYSLCVSERDVVGYGAEACLSITVDKTPPTIANYNVADGFITSISPITISYMKDGVAGSFPCNLTDNVATNCSQTVLDAAGNSATVTRNIWYRSNVIFVKAGASGKGGTSWDDAYGDIPSAIASFGSRPGRIEVWVSEGTYTGFGLSRSTTSIYGGFSATGYPNAVSGRDLSGKVSRIRPDSVGLMIQITYDYPTICRNAIVDGFHINNETGQAIQISHSENATISNFWIESNRNTSGGAGLISITNGDAIFDKVYVRDNYSAGYTAIYIYSGGQVSISNSEIINNETGTTFGSGSIASEYGGPVKIRASKLYRNRGGSGIGAYQGHNYNGGVWDIDQCTVQGMRAGFYPEVDPTSAFILWGPLNVAY